MDGGGIVMEHGQVVSAWRRESDVYLAAAGKPERKIGSGKDVAIAAGPKGFAILIGWTGAWRVHSFDGQSLTTVTRGDQPVNGFSRTWSSLNARRTDTLVSPTDATQELPAIDL